MSLYYKINKEKLIKTIEMYKESAKLFYPIKVNSNGKLLKILNPCVDGYEVDSYELLVYLIKNYKIDPNRIIYSSLINDISTIKAVLSYDITTFVVDDINEIGQILLLSNNKRIDFIVRIDISNYIEYSGPTLKWGISSKYIKTLLEVINKSNSQLIGISFHLPQEVSTYDNFIKTINGINKDIGFNNLKIIDIGGGVSPTDLKKIKDYSSDYIDFNKTRLYIEPGRHLLNPCIDLICTVKDVRIKNNIKLLYLNCGIYNGLLDVVMKNKQFIIRTSDNLELNNDIFEKYLICGPTSDISDIIGTYYMPSSIQKGTKLIISNCGAYCSELETHFYKKRRANYIVDSKMEL